MPPHDDSAQSDAPLPLDALIRGHMQSHGWSYTDLERVSDRALTRGRWQQLGSGVPQRKFPDPASLAVISEVLEIDITTVVLAAARSLGLDVRREGADLARFLPYRTQALSERMRDAILTLIRAAVAESATDGSTGPDHPEAGRGVRMGWPKSSAPSGAVPREPDDPARRRGRR